LNLSVKPDDFRALVVAKIAKIKMFNRTSLKNPEYGFSKDERKGDEFDYLRFHAIEWSDVKDLNDSDERKAKFLREHPRYPTLVKSNFSFLIF
jgi:hypothetical protein